MINCFILRGENKNSLEFFNNRMAFSFMSFMLSCFNCNFFIVVKVISDGNKALSHAMFLAWEGFCQLTKG